MTDFPTGEGAVKAALVLRCNTMFSALLPFVEAMGWNLRMADDAGLMDSQVVGVLYGPGTQPLTMGMFRAARRAIAEAEAVSAPEGRLPPHHEERT